MTSAPYDLFRAPAKPIGRRQELEAINVALAGSFQMSRALYFFGDGGMGKTFLLLEANRRAQALPGVLATGLIDLYQTRHRQPLMLLRALTRRVQRSLEYEGEIQNVFTSYDAALAKYIQTRRETGVEQPKLRAAIESAFRADYANLARDFRIVVLIDTFEQLHPEIEGTEDFNFRQTTRLEQWLARFLRRLPNTLVLIAGRERPKQQQMLRQTYRSGLTTHHITPFDVGETTEYTRVSLPDEYGLDDELFETLQRVSSGRPVVLAIAIAFARAGILDAIALPAEFENNYPSNREHISEAFVRDIVKKIKHERPDVADLLTKAAVLRKGLDGELLRRLGQVSTDGSEDEAFETLLAEFRALPFVKVSGDTVTLHDEMYDLLFGKLNEAEEADWYRAAIAYLDERIAEDKTPTDDQDDNPHQFRAQQTLLVERLFYQLALNPVLGYQEYREISRDAVRARDADFDAQLQSELAGFFDPETVWGRAYRLRLQLGGIDWQQVVFDESVSWIIRRTETRIKGENSYLAARAMAERVQQKFQTIVAENTLASADLESARLDPEVYLAQSPEGVTGIAARYTAVTEQLEVLLTELQQRTQSSSLDAATIKYIKSLLAYGYNRWGYHERARQRMQSAIDKYRRSIILFKELGPDNDRTRAIALNNMAYAMALEGALDHALFLSRQALGIFERLGVRHMEASALNTIARIELERDQGAEALRYVERARKLFKSIISVRYPGLNAHAEGDIRRWLAFNQSLPREQNNKEYDQAFRCYRRAITLLDEENELLRRVEARQGLGCAYRSRGFDRFERGELYRDDMEQARFWLYEALKLCPNDQTWPVRARVLEDVAVTYVNEKQYDQAEARLQEARAAIPAIYDIVEGVGVTNSPETLGQHVFWKLLGQIELQYSMCSFGRQNYIDACVRLLRAFACILTFSTRAPQLSALRSLGRRELALIQDSELLEELRVETYWAAQRLHVGRDEVAEMERLFENALDDLELL